MTDETLFAEYVDNKNQNAFTVLHDRHAIRLTKWISNQFVFADKGEATDIVQTAFMNLHISKDKFERDKPFLPWLCKAVRYAACMDSRNRRRTKRGGDVQIQSIGDDRHIGDSVLNNDMELEAKPTTLAYFEKLEDGDVTRHDTTHEEINSIIGTLSPEDRELYDLLFVQGLKEREAAEAMGITRHKLRVQAADMYRRLKSTLTL